MDNSFKYEPKPKEKLRADYSRRKADGHNAFKDFEEFYNWYNKQEKVCHYCGIKESESQEIVLTGILKSKRFPQKGKLGRGQSRGVWLEIDRLEPNKDYSINNCVLSCYFCNNDKSDVFHGDDYKKFIDDRSGYLRNLLKQYHDK